MQTVYIKTLNNIFFNKKILKVLQDVFIIKIYEIYLFRALQAEIRCFAAQESGRFAQYSESQRKSSGSFVFEFRE